MHTDPHVENGTLYWGTFNCEKYWRPGWMASMPAVTDPQADRIVAVMDEIQFVFCERARDMLLTRLKMDEAHVEYLRAIGYAFDNRAIYPDLEAFDACENNLGSLCGKILARGNGPEAGETPIGRLSPYAVLPETARVYEKYGGSEAPPDMNSVIKVNSKVFSHDLGRKCLANQAGVVIESGKDLKYWGGRFLKQSPVLLKDDYGVSGKGNIFIGDAATLERVADYLDRQEMNRKTVRCLLEPYYDKETDFSCQLEIGRNREARVVTVQVMENRGMAFSRITGAGGEFIERLKQAGYFRQVLFVAETLAAEGYYGMLGIDSMVLRDQTLVPLVEINARKTMGLVNYYLDRYLEPYAAKSKIITLNFSAGEQRRLTGEEVLARLQKAGVLFTPAATRGLIPLTVNTGRINLEAEKTTAGRAGRRKGRLYAAAAARGEAEQDRIIAKARDVLAGLKLQVG